MFHTQTATMIDTIIDLLSIINQVSDLTCDQVREPPRKPIRNAGLR